MNMCELRPKKTVFRVRDLSDTNCAVLKLTLASTRLSFSDYARALSV